MDAVGQLDENDPKVVDHGQDDFAYGLSLAHLGGGFLNPAHLGDPFYQVSHFLAEVLPEVGGGDVGILQDVMQEAGDEGGAAQLQVGQHAGDFQGVAEVGFAGAPGLAFVRPGRKDIRLLKLVDFLLAVRA